MTDNEIKQLKKIAEQMVWQISEDVADKVNEHLPMLRQDQSEDADNVVFDEITRLLSR